MHVILLKQWNHDWIEDKWMYLTRAGKFSNEDNLLPQFCCFSCFCRYHHQPFRTWKGKKIVLFDISTRTDISFISMCIRSSLFSWISVVWYQKTKNMQTDFMVYSLIPTRCCTRYKKNQKNNRHIHHHHSPKFSFANRTMEQITANNSWYDNQ